MDLIEPGEAKVSRRVPRGLGPGNGPRLPYSRALFFSEFDPDGRDEEVGEKDIEHVAIPGAPRAMLVMAHAEAGLVFFCEKTRLDGPAKSRDRAEGLERGALRSVREAALAFLSVWRNRSASSFSLSFRNRSIVVRSGGSRGNRILASIESSNRTSISREARSP